MAPHGHKTPGQPHTKKTTLNTTTPPHTCENPAQRILLIASTGYGYIPPVIRDILTLGNDHTPDEQPSRGAFPGGRPESIERRGPIVGGRVLVVRGPEVVGAERSAARLWVAAGGRVEHVADDGGRVVDEVLRVDVVVVAVRDRDVLPLAVVEACEEAGVPVLVHWSGRYPYREGTPQALGKHRAQAAAAKRAARTRMVPRAA